MRACCRGEGGGAGAGARVQGDAGRCKRSVLWCMCKGAGAVRWTVPVLGLNTTGESMTVSCTSVTYFPL